jgi:AAA domain
VGKGFLTLQICKAVAIGTEILGHVAPKRQRVLYYSAEDGRKRLGQRMRKLIETLTPDEQAELKMSFRIIDASDLDVLYGAQSSTGSHKAFARVLGATADYAKLQRMVEHFDPQLVVVDPASDTFGGNEISKADVRAFVKLLKRVHPRRKIGVLLNVHIDRASARGHTTGDDGYAGSVQWHNSCRRRLYLQSKKEKAEDGIELPPTVLLKVEKNQDGQPAPDLELLRDLYGFWLPAVQLKGELAGAIGPVPSETLLRLIDEYYQRGKWISPSLAGNATTGVYDTLRGDPQFPLLNKKKTAEIVRNLERDGSLDKETYRRPEGGNAQRWKVVPKPQYTAPGT